jgi:hypothetical protein
MKDIAPNVLAEMQEAMCCPEGTLFLRFSSPDLFNAKKSGGKIWEMPAGQHLFLIERTDDLILQFYHSSPGMGTRVAKIQLKELTPCNPIGITITWAHSGINLYAGPIGDPSQLQSGVGAASKKGFRIARDEAVYQVGDESVDVMGISVYQGDKPILQPTALDAWQNTIKAIEVLGTGTSSEGYIFEVVCTNLTLAILVTGIEAYTKTRFLELEGEGIKPDVIALAGAVIPRREREAGLQQILESEANDEGRSVLSVIAERINFQNFQECKRGYNKAYGVKFGEIGLDSNSLDSLQRFIRYRHRIVHVSPLIGMLNQSDVPIEGPVFPKKDLAQQAVALFNSFIEKLHEATLRLRRTD